MQFGEDGVGRRKNGLIAYKATPGRLAERGTGKRRRWRLRCGLRRSRRVGGGSWPRAGNKRWTRLDSPGEERGNETGKVVIAHGSSVGFCEATAFGLVDESKEFLYGRETDRDLRSA